VEPNSSSHSVFIESDDRAALEGPVDVEELADLCL